MSKLKNHPPCARRVDDHIAAALRGTAAYLHLQYTPIRALFSTP